MSRHGKSLYFLSLAFILGCIFASPEAEAQKRVRGKPAKPAKVKAKKAAKAKTATSPNRATTRPLVADTTPAAAKSPSAKLQTTLTAALKRSDSQYFVREVDGVKRIIANVSGQAALDEVSATFGANSDTIQVIHIGRGDIQHTMAIFDGELLHAQHVTKTDNWRLRNWGDILRASSTKMYSAFIALTPGEANTLRTTIAGAKRDQGPEVNAGPKWVNGKLKNTSMGGCRSFDCTTSWTDMPIGKQGETLAQVAGFSGGYSRHPRFLQKNLEIAGGERVAAIVVYGPREANFGAAPAEPVTKF